MPDQALPGAHQAPAVAHQALPVARRARSVAHQALPVARQARSIVHRLPVLPRHPYGGELVHTAFSGTHQDAIGKGFAPHVRRAVALGVPESEAPWEVPYLPVDPAALGRSYEAVIRVNSQSGKGITGHLFQAHHGIDLPPGLRAEFSRVVQHATDRSGTEATADELWQLFTTAYLTPGEHGTLVLEPWSPGALESWSPGVLESWSPGTPTGRRPASTASVAGCTAAGCVRLARGHGQRPAVRLRTGTGRGRTAR